MKTLNFIKTYFSPEDDLNRIYLGLVRNAKKSIYIVDYSFNLLPLVNILNAKVRDEIDVRMCLDKSQSGGESEKLAISKMSDELKHHVVFGDSSRGKIIHDKFTIIDGKIVESGSWNYTFVAEEEDNFIDIINSKQRAKAFTAAFERIYTRLLMNGN
jgi:phosphatidylserine/phosphatidylglycerophosphate/cardiolipin synthase-like enzyme